MSPQLQLWMPAVLSLFGALIVVVLTAWLNTRMLSAQVESVRSELRTEIQSVHREIESVHTELRTEIQSVHREVESVRTELRAEMRALEERIGRQLAELELRLTTQISDLSHRIERLEEARGLG